MKYLSGLLLFTLSTLAFQLTAKQNYALVIVANTQNEDISITRRDVRNLFMGGVIKHELHAVILPPENETRVVFNTKVVGLTESRIQSYWAQMRFSGRKKEPREMVNEEQLIEYLKMNEGSIAYLSAQSTIPSELTVLLTIE